MGVRKYSRLEGLAGRQTIKNDNIRGVPHYFWSSPWAEVNKI